MKWNNCELVHENEEFFYFEPELNSKILNAFQTYSSVIRRNPKKKVWYDFKDDVCFGEEQDFYMNPNDFSFFSAKDAFLDNEKNPHWGKCHILEKFGAPLGLKIIESPDYIVPVDVFDDFKDKHILIIGAGPSTNDVEWKDVDYDHIWTCNNFFLNDKINHKKVSLAVLGPNTDLADETLIYKLAKDDTLCVFEGGASPFRNLEVLIAMKKIHSKVSYYHLRYFSKIGTAPRLIVLATLMGAKKISFVGVDGHPLGNPHAFDGDSKIHNGAPLVKNSYNIFRRQYVLLWDYLLNDIGQQVEYRNLGSGHSANLSTDMV